MDINIIIEVLSNFNNDYVLTDEEITAVGSAVEELEAIRDSNYIPKYVVAEMSAKLEGIRRILNEWSHSDHVELTKTEYFDKIIELMNKNATADAEAIKQHFYEISYKLDKYSAYKDYNTLRKAHYDNIDWLKEHQLENEYYDALMKFIKEEKYNEV